MTTIIFGGTAAYHLKLHDHATVGERRVIATPYGDSAPFVHLTANGHSAWFSSRHGEDGLQRTAAFVNHRANIWAAAELGADAILSWNGVGAIAAGLAVGQMVVPHDLLDMTRARVGSFEYPPHPPTPSPLRKEGEPNATIQHDAVAAQTNRLAPTRTNTELWRKIKPLAREMRIAPTPAEEKLWGSLRGKQLSGFRFRRQHPIDRFIVDFYCAEARLVIEVDGEIHAFSQEEDALRTEFLESRGIRVIRFKNEMVLADVQTVCSQIGEALNLLTIPSNLVHETSKQSPLIAKRGGDLGVGTNTPFAEDLRQRLIGSCQSLNFPCATHGTYVCTEGPRLETAAEIAMYGWGGAAVVGMTLSPEVWLAAELGIPYASLCIITNMATGRWSFDPRRDFGPGVGVKGLQITLAAT